MVTWSFLPFAARVIVNLSIISTQRGHLQVGVGRGVGEGGDKRMGVEAGVLKGREVGEKCKTWDGKNMENSDSQERKAQEAPEKGTGNGKF